MVAWMQALEDRDWKDADNVDEDIETEVKELELDRKRAQTTEYQTQDFAIHLKIQGMIAPEKEESTSRRNVPVMAGLAQDKMIETLQDRYDGAKERTKTTLFNLV